MYPVEGGFAYRFVQSKTSVDIFMQNRVQQTIRSQESSIISYKIANLLQFYMLTMQRTIGEKAALSEVLQE